MKHRLLSGLTALALSLTACGGGGGGGGDIGLPIGGGSGGGSGNWNIRIVDFRTNNANLQVGSSATLSWQVDYSDPTGTGYYVEIFAYNNPSVPPAPVETGLYRIFQLNCGPTFVALGGGCDKTGSAYCEVQNLMGMPTILCRVPNSSASPQSKTLLVSGGGYLVMRACTSLFNVCDVKAINANFP